METKDKANELIFGSDNTFGSDPEFFIVSKRYGKVFTPNRFKKVNLPVRYHHDNQPPIVGEAALVEDKYGYYHSGSIKRDGPALEVNPKEGRCRDNQVPFFFYALEQIHNMLKVENMDRGFKLSANSVAELSKASLKNAPEDISEFGCSPDWDAYTMSEKVPLCPPNHKARYAGGHIHVTASGKEASKRSANLAILFDYLIGFPAVGMLGPKYAEQERARREFYGQAGSFRHRPGVFEYRVLSNTGFAVSPVPMTMWLGVVKKTPVNSPDKIETALKLFNSIIPVEDVQNAINTHDYEFVWNNFDRWLQLYPSSMYSAIPHNLAQMYSAAQNSETWDDDIFFNWGVGFPKFKAVHHAYWGHENAAKGWLSKVILPGTVTQELQKQINKYGYSGEGYNVDHLGSRLHPSEPGYNKSAKQKRGW